MLVAVILLYLFDLSCVVHNYIYDISLIELFFRVCTYRYINIIYFLKTRTERKRTFVDIFQCNRCVRKSVGGGTVLEGCKFIILLC